jgi:chemotaxis protein methyltransferase CheR
MSDTEFRLIADLVTSAFGINLPESKRTLVRGRLHKLIIDGGFASFQEYYNAVVADRSGARLLECVDRISTNHTSFLRERAHFDFLTETILPELVAGPAATDPQRIAIWCAGCSSGEEPYSVAMTIRDALGTHFGDYEVRILGTDISLTALREALEAVYTIEHTKDLPASWLLRYFDQVGPGLRRVRGSIRQNVLFKRLNLMRPIYPFKRQFDLILCRNVMIYFDRMRRKDLVEKFHRHLRPGGHLLIGHSETLGRENHLFRALAPSVYRKIDL